MTALLDVNVLIAMSDPMHGFHDAAHQWFEAVPGRAWATGPMTENGFLRVLGQPGYPGSYRSPANVVPLLLTMRAIPGHVHWSDGIALIDSPIVSADQITTSGRVTDTYLLALAVTQGGRLATFDRKLNPSAVKGGAAALELIPA